MFTIDDFRVKLVNHEEVGTFIEQHGRFASVCYNTPKEKAVQVGMGCLKSGHFSGSRHLYFVFDIKRVPRFLIDQLVRHEIGVVKNVESLRYVNKSGDFEIFAPPEVFENVESLDDFRRMENYANATYKLGMKHLSSPLTPDIPNVSDVKRRQEICRGLLPIGIESSCSFAINLEALINLSNKRLCERAELPIRKLVESMVITVCAYEPLYSKFLVPNCQKLGYCPEGKMGCGIMPTKEEL